MHVYIRSVHAHKSQSEIPGPDRMLTDVGKTETRRLLCARHGSASLDFNISRLWT